MTRKERLDFKVQTRITQSQKEQLDELDANLRDIIDYYIVHNTNKTMELRNRQKRLLKEIHEMEKDLSDKKEELKEVNEQLGVPDDENSATIEVSTISERIKSNCQQVNNGKCNKIMLGNFITSKRGKRIIEKGMIEFGINGDEKQDLFKENILKYLKIDDEVVLKILKS